MTVYEDFVWDYPARCIDVLYKFYEHAKFEDREVTLLLMATAGGFVMPYERLKPGGKPELDRDTNKEQIKKLKNELEKPIKNSTAFGEIINKWCYGEPGEQHDEENVMRVAESSKPINGGWKVSVAINIVRNSIAHGNVLAIRSPEGQIQDLVFASKISSKSSYVHLVKLTPDDLRDFLLSWFRLLEWISQRDALRLLESVAT